MTEEREVVARLKVQKEGETDAFKDLATDLKGVDAPATSAAEAMGAFFDKLRDPAIEKGPAALNEIEAAMRAVTVAADEFASAEGPKDQAEAVKKLEEAWVSFGDQFSSQIGQSIELSKAFEEQLEAIQKKGEALADPISAGLTEIREQLSKLDASGEKGFFGFDRGAASAVSSIKALKQEIAAAEAEGRDVGEGARQSLAELETQLHGTITAAGKFRNTQADVRQEMREVRSETDLGRGSITDLGDIFERMSPKIAKFIGTAAGIAGALAAGYEAGTKLREGLNWLTDGDFDEGVQSLISNLFRLDDGLSSTAENTQRLTNLQNILKKNGIDPTNLSLAEMEKQVSDLTKKKYELATATEKLAESLGVSEEALKDQAKALAASIAEFSRINPNLLPKDLAKIFGEQVQEILDGYALLKKAPDEALGAIARSWGVTTTVVEEATKKQKAAVVSMWEEITGQTAKSATTLQQQAVIISKAFSSINFDTLNPAGLERAEKVLEEFIAKSRVAGVQIPKDIADQAASLGILVAAYEVAGGGTSAFAGHQADLAGQTVHTTQVFDAHGKELSSITTASAAAGVAAKAAGTNIKAGADEAGQGKTPLEGVVGVIHTAKGDFEIVASSAKTMGAGVKAGAEDAAKGNEPLTSVGKAGGEAGAGLAAVVSAAAGIGKSGDVLKTAATEMKTPLGDIATEGGKTATALGAINEIKYPAAIAELNLVLTKLKEVQTQAGATKAALLAIDSDDAGPAAPVTAAPDGGGDTGGGGGGPF